MGDPKQSVVVEVLNLHKFHPRLAASDWRSPLVFRLLKSRDYQDGEKVVEDRYSGRNGLVVEGSLLLRWEDLESDFKARLNTYQEPVLTEHAALGLACILVRERAKMEMTEVTRRGERADYWLGDKELMLEVSGQCDGRLDDLLRTKTQQLKGNPFQKHGYVCVANFDKEEACLMFVKHEGGVDGA